jgi:TetR/AcrR family transcriptional regulator, cholesterol catabolism regulator
VAKKSDGNFCYEKSFHSFVPSINSMDIQERILTKSHELFMRYGIRSISMDEIAGHLGMSKKTIYQYYVDKDALVEGVINMEIVSKEEKCLFNKEHCNNAIHEIFMAVDMVQELLKGMIPAVLYDLEKYHPRGFKKFDDHRNNFFYKVMRDNLQRGITEELYKPDINIDILARFRVASVFLIFSIDGFITSKASAHDVLIEITDNFLYGIATSKGQKLINKFKTERQQTTLKQH